MSRRSSSTASAAPSVASCIRPPAGRLPARLPLHRPPELRHRYRPGPVHLAAPAARPQPHHPDHRLFPRAAARHPGQIPPLHRPAERHRPTRGRGGGTACRQSPGVHLGERPHPHPAHQQSYAAPINRFQDRVTNIHEHDLARCDAVDQLTLPLPGPGRGAHLQPHHRALPARPGPSSRPRSSPDPPRSPPCSPPTSSS